MTSNSKVTLRKTVADDLAVLFTFQLDPDANYLAAFTSPDSTDKAAYLQRYTKFLDDPTINTMTIMVDGVIAGSIAKFGMDGEADITYWIDKKFWNKGVATKTLQSFLAIENTRPLFARVAFDNVGSQRVLEKCAFTRVGKDRGFANARQKEVEECVYKLS